MIKRSAVRQAEERAGKMPMEVGSEKFYTVFREIERKSHTKLFRAVNQRRISI